MRKDPEAHRSCWHFRGMPSAVGETDIFNLLNIKTFYSASRKFLFTLLYFILDFIIYLTEIHTVREGTQARRVGEGEAGSPAEQGARCGFRSQNPRIMT